MSTASRDFDGEAGVLRRQQPRYLGDPSARGDALIWSIFHEQSPVRSGKGGGGVQCPEATSLNFSCSPAHFMSAEKEEREGGGRMAGERGGVEEEKQQSHRVWTFISMTSGIIFPPGAEFGAGRPDSGEGDYILSSTARDETQVSITETRARGHEGV